MPPADQNLKEEVRNRIDIADLVGRYVKLKQSGRNLKGLCPFHQEKTPSFVVSPERGSFHCFGCGKGGDIFTFVQEIESLDFVEALRLLADEAGIEVKKQSYTQSTPSPGGGFPSKATMLAIHKTAARFYYQQMRRSREPIDYFKSRGLTGETIRDFVLGYAPPGWSNLLEHAVSRGIAAKDLVACGLAVQKSGSTRPYDRFRERITFTLFDTWGRPIGFAARAMQSDAQPKYLNSPETPIYRKGRTLYGLHKSRDAVKEHDKVLVVEGYMDLLSLYQAGIRNVVATSGTALTPHHGQLIRRFTTNVVLVFDGDSAGIAAAERAVFVLMPLNLDLKVLILPHDQDPDSFVRASGPSAFLQLADNARDGFSFVLDKAMADHRGETPRGQAAVLNHLKPLLESITEPTVTASLVKSLSERLGLREPVTYGKLNLPYQGSRAPRATGAGHQDYQGTVEGNFIRLLVQNPGLVEEAKQYISPETLSDRFTSDLYSLIVRAHAKNPSLTTILDQTENAETKSVLASMIAGEQSSDSPNDDLIHTMERLQIKFLRHRIKEVGELLKRQPERREEFLRTQKELLTELKELTRSQ